MPFCTLQSWWCRARLLTEIVLVKFRKIPFTCSYPTLESNLGSFWWRIYSASFVFTDYLPEMEHWSFDEPLRAVSFIALFAIAFVCVYGYRKQMLEMDEELCSKKPPIRRFSAADEPAGAPGVESRRHDW